MNHASEVLFLQPLMMERVWGGNRLGALYGKSIPAGKVIGESWEVSDRPEAQSRIVGGEFDGKNLGEVLKSHCDAIMGSLTHRYTRFPLLIKYVDAGTALSVQVHPDDAGAKPYNDRGKSECWVVVHAESGAKIVRGLKSGITKADYERAVARDEVETVLHSFTPRVGDVVALPAGMVHAIGAGLVVAEIQQNSDLTFRIYDYKRMGLDGKPRQLHVQEALNSISFGRPGDAFSGDMHSDTVKPLARESSGGVEIERVLEGRYFRLLRYTLSPRARTRIPAADAPRVGMAIGGSGTLQGRRFPAGQTVLLPADLPEAELTAEDAPLTFLLSTPTLAACG